MPVFWEENVIGGRVELGAEGYRVFCRDRGKGRVRGEFAERYTLSVAHHFSFILFSLHFYLKCSFSLVIF